MQFECEATDEDIPSYAKTKLLQSEAVKQQLRTSSAGLTRSHSYVILVLKCDDTEKHRRTHR